MRSPFRSSLALVVVLSAVILSIATDCVGSWVVAARSGVSTVVIPLDADTNLPPPLKVVVQTNQVARENSNLQRLAIGATGTIRDGSPVRFVDPGASDGGFTPPGLWRAPVPAFGYELADNGGQLLGSGLLLEGLNPASPDANSQHPQTQAIALDCPETAFADICTHTYSLQLTGVPQGWLDLVLQVQGHAILAGETFTKPVPEGAWMKVEIAEGEAAR